MNVTATPFRPPPFSLSQDPLLAAGLTQQPSSPPPLLSGPPSSLSGLGGGSPNGGLMGMSGTSMNAATGAGMMGMGAYTSTSNGGGGGGLGLPPMMSLNGGGGGGQHQQQNGGGGGQQQGGPVKYKTELCRNWEATGHCGYRGCTYAHGYEDLRNGISGGPHGMMMGGGGGPGPLGMGTPQQHTYSYTNNVVNPGAMGGGHGANSGRSSALGTPVAGTYRMGAGGALVGPGGLGGIGNNSPIPAAPAPIQAAMPQPISCAGAPPCGATEQLLDLITMEIRLEKDKLYTYQSTNRQLEQQLKREQLLRQRNVNNATVVEGVIAMVEEAIRKRHAVLMDLKHALGEDAMEAAVDAMLDGDDESF